MPNSPEYILDPRRIEILQKSPLLQDFLDSSMQSDPDIWKTALEQNGQMADNASLSVPSALSDIFDPSVSHNTQLGTISLVTAIGYEIGDTFEAMMFFNIIQRRLYPLGILNTQKDKEATVIDGLCSALLTGVERNNREIEAASKEFRDFIHGPKSQKKLNFK